MTDRPIMLRPPQIVAILASRQTSIRVLASHPVADCQPRDRLWVRESVTAALEPGTKRRGVQYLADDTGKLIPDLFEYDRKWEKLHAYGKGEGKTVPARHMPKWASRLTLTVHDVVEQRLHDVTEADIIDEGVSPDHPQLRAVFARRWDETAPTGSKWTDNPAIAAISFTPALMSIGA